MLVQKRPGGVEIVRDGAKQTRVWRTRLADGTVWVRTGGVTTKGHGDDGDDVARQSAAGGSREDLVAQFPGRVRKVLVKSGVAVKADESLLMIEAMKMEFPIKAPYNGVVRKILVTEGEVLSPGQLLVDLEPEGKS